MPLSPITIPPCRCWEREDGIQETIEKQTKSVLKDVQQRLVGTLQLLQLVADVRAVQNPVLTQFTVPDGRTTAQDDKWHAQQSEHQCHRRTRQHSQNQ